MPNPLLGQDDKEDDIDNVNDIKDDMEDDNLMIMLVLVLVT